MPAEDEIYQVKRRHSAQLLKIPGVHGVGVERGKQGSLVIMLHVSDDGDNVKERLPNELEGYPVEVVRSGPFEKL